MIFLCHRLWQWGGKYICRLMVTFAVPDAEGDVGSPFAK